MNPEMSKKQAQFFAGLILLCTLTAVLVLAIDYQIKGAIIEQANNLRRDIDRLQSGQRTTTAGSNGSGNYPANHVSYPADLVRSRDARMETPGPDNQDNREDNTQEIRTPKPSRADGASPVPGTDQQSES
jgi:hypothetical protein